MTDEITRVFESEQLDAANEWADTEVADRQINGQKLVRMSIVTYIETKVVVLRLWFKPIVDLKVE